VALTNFTTGSGLVTTSPAFTPEDFGSLVDVAVKAKSVAARTVTGFATNKDRVVFPKYVGNPSVAFYGELDTIAESNIDTDEVPVTIHKTAGLVLLSNELRDDSDPAVADLVGSGLANVIGRAIDGAFLGNTAAKAPSGLQSISYTSVDTGATLTNLDPFIEARYEAEVHGSQLTSWIVHPEVAKVLSKMKVASGSNQNLIQFVEDGITVAGLPVVVSDQVDVTTLFWGVPRDHIVLVNRLGTTVERFPAVEKDGTYVRAVARFGIGFLNEAGVIRGYNAP
jgi:HK97 family phage major capsid protein